MALRAFVPPLLVSVEGRVLVIQGIGDVDRVFDRVRYPLRRGRMLEVTGVAD